MHMKTLIKIVLLTLVLFVFSCEKPGDPLSLKEKPICYDCLTTVVQKLELANRGPNNIGWILSKVYDTLSTTTKSFCDLSELELIVLLPKYEADNNSTVMTNNCTSNCKYNGVSYNDIQTYRITTTKCKLRE